jgi:hypothetical protein
VTITLQNVLVVVLPTPDLAAENLAVMPDNLVYAADGTEMGPIGELVGALAKSAYARDYLLAEAKEDHVWFELRWEPPRDHLGNPLFLRKLVPETLREIGSIQIKGPCEFKISEFRLRRGTLGEVQLAWGKTEIQGHPTMIVATRDARGAEKISLTVSGTPPQIDASSPNKRMHLTTASGACGSLGPLARGGR